MSGSSLFINPLSANPTKWSNTLKQFFGKRIVWVCCGHSVGLAPKVLMAPGMKESLKSGSHLLKCFLFASMVARQKWWKMFISS